MAGNERYRYPGVFTSEVPMGGEPLQPAGSAASAFIGTAEWGPMNTPTLVTSWADFVRKFGNDFVNGYLAYGARDFFRMGGQRLYVVRTCHYSDITEEATLTAVKAVVEVTDGEATPTTLMTFTAKYYGTYGNDLSIQIANVDSENDNFDVYVIRTIGTKTRVVERFLDMSLDSTSDFFVEDVMNDHATKKSTLVTVAVDDDSVLPTASTNVMLLGFDGLGSIADADYYGDPASETGLYALDRVNECLSIVHPGITAAAVMTNGQTYVNTRMARKGIDVYVMDLPLGYTPQEAYEWVAENLQSNGNEAIYYPWVVEGTTNKPTAPYMCGIYAQNDWDYGVWAAPAGVKYPLPITELAHECSLGEGQLLNPVGINVIAQFPFEGFLPWGVRTLDVHTHFRYLNVRRFVNVIKKTLQDGGLQFVFELNAPATWRRVEDTAAMLLMYYHSLGAFAGKTPEESFYVKCDATTNPDELVDQGIMTCVVGICPVKPAEFIEFEVQLFNTGDLPMAESAQES